MLVTRKLIDSILPENLKQLIDDETCPENLNTVAENLQINLEQVKNEINDLKSTSFSEIQPEISKIEAFTSKINELHKQIDNINNELDEQENLLKNVSQIEEYKDLVENIETINKIIVVFEALQEYELYLFEFKNSIDSKDYPICYENLRFLTKLSTESNLFKNVNNSKEETSPVPIQKQLIDTEYKAKEILIVRKLKEEFIVQRERLWYELDNEWDNLIKINELTCEISIKFSQLNQNHMDKLTQFSHLKQTQIDQSNISFVFSSKLRHLAKYFLKICQSKIINNSTSLLQVEVNSDLDFYHLKFIQQTNQPNLDTLELLEFKLNQIEKILKFLYFNFLKFQTHAVKITKPGSSESISPKLINLFSDLTAKEFFKLIHEQLITNIMPLNQLDFSLEEKIHKQLFDFEEKLKSLEYLQISDENFKNLLSSVEELYVRKKCKHLMETARGMMKNQDLIFELVSTEINDLDLKKFKENFFINDLIKLNQENTSKTLLDEMGLLKIPKFSVSRLVYKLLELVNDTLTEAFRILNANKQSLKSVSLFCLIARNLFDLYASVVPTHYANNLRDLPQLSAIVFNDFYYLSLSCLTLGHKYKILLKNLKNSPVNSLDIEYADLEDLVTNFSFLDLIPKLYSLGYEILFKQIQMQEKNLLQFLNEDSPNGIRCLCEGNNFEMFKKSLQKCIYQLNNLSSVWLGVLSDNLYSKVFGQLFELILNDLIKSCLKLEDISSDDASYLVSLFSLLKQAAYDLYLKILPKPESDESSDETVNLNFTNNLADLNASKYIKSWQRFKYLIILLEANLQQIVDLWSDGKGPLALYYDSEEVRHLIKALFMITERRSAALAKIK